jgi:hypothetical protein
LPTISYDAYLVDTDVKFTTSGGTVVVVVWLVAPVAPDAPLTPVGPVAPDAPLTPVAPVVPVDPLAPVDPVAPVAPEVSNTPVLSVASVVTVVKFTVAGAPNDWGARVVVGVDGELPKSVPNGA